jgi:hypothetical protein
MKSRPFQVGRIYADTDDATILADGQRFRVPTLMRDGETCDDCGVSGRYPASVRCPTCGDRNALTDAETQLQDHLARDQEYRRTHSGNMPGYRFAADSEERRASRQQLHDAYAEYEARLTSSWKGLEPLNQNPDVDWSTAAGSPSRNFGKPAPEGSVCTTSDGRPGHIVNGECVASHEDSSRPLADKRAEHQRVMNDIYEQYSRQQSEAYRTLK